jgi:hypothetical protein
MSDSQRNRSAPEPERRDAESELIEAALRKIITAIVIAGALIALAIWARPSPHYQVAVGDGRIVRINTQSGTVIACEGETCAIVLQHGKHLERHLPAPALPAPAPAPAPAAAAPQAAPAPALAPAAPR